MTDVCADRDLVLAVVEGVADAFGAVVGSMECGDFDINGCVFELVNGKQLCSGAYLTFVEDHAHSAFGGIYRHVQLLCEHQQSAYMIGVFVGDEHGVYVGNIAPCEL